MKRLMMVFLAVFVFQASISEARTVVVVNKGDTLSKIAKEMLGDAGEWRKLASDNDIANPDLIFEGQEIVVLDDGDEKPVLLASAEKPGISDAVSTDEDPLLYEQVYVVVQGDTLSGIGQKYGVSWVDIGKRNGLDHPWTIRVGQELYIPAGSVKNTNNTISGLNGQNVTMPFEGTPSRSENFASTPKAPSHDATVSDRTIAMSQEGQKIDPRVVTRLSQVRDVEEGPSLVYKDKKKESKFNKFVELDAAAGYWKNTKYDTSGIWAEAEILFWFGQKDVVQNWGIGPILKYDDGQADKGTAEWGYVAPGIELGFWKSLSEKDFLLLKPRLTYRFNKEETGRDDGLMPGIYAELTHTFGASDAMIIAGNGWFFPDDNYADVRGYWEHKFSRSVKGKIGIGPVFHWNDSNSFTSISPTVSFKFNDQLSVGAIAEFSDEGPAYGAFISFEFNSSRD